MKDITELKVFITSNETACGECGADLGRKTWIALAGDKGALCLSCADLDHLIYLPAGDAALTRRSRKYSTLAAVVLQWSRARKRYERQGLLVEEGALERAEQECLDDSEVRERRRERDAERREMLDRQYVEQFAERVRDVFPGCPAGREKEISEHACLRYSGRIGRTAMAKDLEEDAVRLAVKAHIRHTGTRYDELLAEGIDRWDARDMVDAEVAVILRRWEEGAASVDYSDSI